MASHEQSGKHGAHNGKKRRNILLIVLAAVAVCILAAVIAVAAVCASWLKDLPDYSTAEDFNTNQPTEVYANDRTTLLARFQLENREPLESLDDISPYATTGTVATEDERFYKHGGIDLIGIGRAVMNNLSGGTLEGASTITQQLVRNTVLADEMTDISIKRKVREAYLSLKMEGLYNKEDILLLYMNTINYGSGAYGIEAAAQRYYSKSASNLTLNEAATLVGIPQSPTYNNPIDYPDHALDRRNIVLDRMVSYGAITQEEADAVKAEPITLNPSTPSNDGILLYPYFSSYVRDQLTSEYALSTSEIFKGGLTVYTTLDPTIQQLAEAAATAKEETLSDELEVALTAIDPETGYVKAMVGGKDYYDETGLYGQWNLAAQAQRPAGSSFKTFTLIAALEQGISPQTQVSCGSSVSINTGYETWKVSNIYNIDYGTRSIEKAFHASSNTGFARLISAVGPESVVDVAHRMGITSDLPSVPALTLGVGEVTTLEMASAYATIAAGGVRHDAVVIEQAVDRRGNVLIDNTSPEGEQVISPEVAHAATEVMRGVIESYEGTGRQAAITTGQVAAGKTGTSEDYKDSWFCGITPQLSVAIWMGDRHNVSTVPSNSYAASVFGDFMSALLEGQPLEYFPEADDPSYTKTFSNTDLDLKGITSSDDEDEDEEEEDEEKDADEKDADEKKDKDSEKSDSSTSKKDDEGASSGGSSSGGSSSGGSSSGGTTVDPEPAPTPTPDPEPEPSQPTPEPAIEPASNQGGEG